MLEVYVTIKDNTNLYYLLKIQRRGLDVYCFPPHLGIHYSLHESGEAHFRTDSITGELRDELPVALIMGEAGTPMNHGIIRAPLSGLSRASGICTVIYPTDSLDNDFRKFTRNLRDCFVIDTQLFPKGTSSVEVGVWAVPDRNIISFEFNNPNIPEAFLYKVTNCEPQIWIYAQPLP